MTTAMSQIQSTPPIPATDEHLRLLWDEYKLLQSKIDKIGSFKFQIKGWTVTLIFGSYVLGDRAPDNFVLAMSFAAIILFCVLEWRQSDRGMRYGNRALQIESLLRRDSRMNRKVSLRPHEVGPQIALVSVPMRRSSRSIAKGRTSTVETKEPEKASTKLRKATRMICKKLGLYWSRVWFYSILAALLVARGAMMSEEHPLSTDAAHLETANELADIVATLDGLNIDCDSEGEASYFEVEVALDQIAAILIKLPELKGHEDEPLLDILAVLEEKGLGAGVLHAFDSLSYDMYDAGYDTNPYSIQLSLDDFVRELAALQKSIHERGVVNK